VLLPVVEVAADAAGEGTLPSLGAERSIDVVELLGGRHPLDEAQETGGQPEGLLGGRWSTVEHEDDVQVARVGQLGSAEATQRDHGERDAGLQRTKRGVERRL